MTSEMKAIESTLSELFAQNDDISVESEMAKILHKPTNEMKWDELPRTLLKYLERMAMLQAHPIMMLMPALQTTSFLHALLIGWRAHEQFAAAKELEKMMEDAT